MLLQPRPVVADALRVGLPRSTNNTIVDLTSDEITR